MSKKITPELRARAVRMVREHREDYPSVTAAAPRWPSSSVWAGRRCAGGWCRPRSTPAPARVSPRRSGRRSNGSRRRTGGCVKTWRFCVRQRLSSRGSSTPATADHGVHRRHARRGPRGRVDLPSAHRARLPGRRTDLPGLEKPARWSLPALVSDAVVDRRAARGPPPTPEGLYGRRKMTHYLRRHGHPTWRFAPCTGSWAIWA